MNIIGFIRPSKNLQGFVRQRPVQEDIADNFYLINSTDFLEINDSQDRLENK